MKKRRKERKKEAYIPGFLQAIPKPYESSCSDQINEMAHTRAPSNLKLFFSLFLFFFFAISPRSFPWLASKEMLWKCHKYTPLEMPRCCPFFALWRVLFSLFHETNFYACSASLFSNPKNPFCQLIASHSFSLLESSERRTLKL